MPSGTARADSDTTSSLKIGSHIDEVTSMTSLNQISFLNVVFSFHHWRRQDLFVFCSKKGDSGTSYLVSFIRNEPYNSFYENSFPFGEFLFDRFFTFHPGRDFPINPHSRFSPRLVQWILSEMLTNTFRFNPTLVSDFG